MDSKDAFGGGGGGDLEGAVLVRQGEEPPAFCALFHGWCAWGDLSRPAAADPWALRQASRRAEEGHLALGRVMDTETTREERDGDGRDGDGVSNDRADGETSQGRGRGERGRARRARSRSVPSRKI